MDIQQAAIELRRRFMYEPAIAAVGVGQHDGAPAIVVYLGTGKAPNLSFLQDGWEGFPVLIKKMGRLMLVSDYCSVR